MATETFVSYWIGEEPNPPSPTLDEMPSFVDVVPLAFVLIDDDWQLDFDTILCKVHPAAVIQGWVRTVRANGSKVLLSINDVKLGSVPDVGTFVEQVVDAAVAWGVDGIDFDYEGWFGDPQQTMIDVVEATRPALAKTLGRDPYLSAPVYDKWQFYPDFLGRLAGQLDLVTTMDYTPYPGYNGTIGLFEAYASAIGGSEKLAVGISCMGPPPPESQNFTPLLDAEMLCHWEPQSAKKAGAMLYTFSYDVETRAGSGTGYPDGTFTRAIEANLP